MAPQLEYAGGLTLERTFESRSAILRRAPSWWRDLVSQPTRSQRQRVADERDEIVGGWIVGVIAPGVSLPAYCPQDRQTLPEAFSKSAWEAVAEQVARKTEPIGLWSDHHGRGLASTSAGTLKIDIHPILGGMFQATLANTSAERMLLTDIGRNGIGVSVGFRAPVLSYEQRDGRKVRVIQRCVVDHVALVQKSSGTRALYSAARAFGVTADNRDQLPQAWSEARTEAWRAMRGGA